MVGRNVSSCAAGGSWKNPPLIRKLGLARIDRCFFKLKDVVGGKLYGYLVGGEVVKKRYSMVLLPTVTV